MGFGSYDESEQKDQDSDFGEDDAVNVHENSHEGDVSFDSDASQDELLDQLNEIKNGDNEDE